MPGYAPGWSHVIPYIEIPSWTPFESLPFLALQPFGILLAIGVLLGSYMGRRYLDRYRMDR